MRNSNRLTAIKVAKVKQPGRYGDGGGLVLQVSKWCTKAWLFRYERHGRERQMGLGPTSTLSLAEAREKAREPCRSPCSTASILSKLVETSECSPGSKPRAA